MRVMGHVWGDFLHVTFKSLVASQSDLNKSSSVADKEIKIKSGLNYFITKIINFNTSAHTVSRAYIVFSTMEQRIIIN